MTEITVCALNKSGNCLPNDITKTIKDNKYTNSLCNEKNNELCKIKNSDHPEKSCLMALFFKPTGSFNENDWLNNTHIDLIQEQLYNKYKHYYYSYIHMADLKMHPHENYTCIKHPIIPLTKINFIDEIKNNNVFNDYLTNDKKNKMKFYGIVFNTDTSDGSGKHWFTILFNFNTKGNELDPFIIEYFNSSGNSIKSKYLHSYLEAIAMNITIKTNKTCIFKQISNIEHQSEDTGNCGIYSLYYIWKRISGTPYTFFADNKITDNEMTYFRQIFLKEQ